MTIKNLSKNIVKQNSNFHIREDLNFSDDGNRFRGFDYKGMPITTLRADDTTYLCIRVDYLETSFTYNEWMETEEYRLADEFNGVAEIDLDKLIDNCEKIIAKVAEMNAKAEEEEIDMTEVKARYELFCIKAEAAILEAKSVKWWDMPEWKLNEIKSYMKRLETIRADYSAKDLDSLSNREKKEAKERKTLNGEWYIEQIKSLCK